MGEQEGCRPNGGDAKLSDQSDGDEQEGRQWWEQSVIEQDGATAIRQFPHPDGSRQLPHGAGRGCVGSD